MIYRMQRATHAVGVDHIRDVIYPLGKYHKPFAVEGVPGIPKQQ